MERRWIVEGVVGGCRSATQILVIVIVELEMVGVVWMDRGERCTSMEEEIVVWREMVVVVAEKGGLGRTVGMGMSDRHGRADWHLLTRRGVGWCFVLAQARVVFSDRTRIVYAV